jgi:hypothetical protein
VDVFKHPPSDQEFETEFIKEALDAYRQGHLLIAIAPDLATKNAELLLAKTYRLHWSFKPPEQRKRWWKKWPLRISEFENEVLNRPSNEKINPQIFVHYRRAMDGITFSELLGSHPTRCQHILRAREHLVRKFLSTIVK